jgi:hypothetical protein
MKTIKGALNGKHLCASIFGGSADISKTFVMNPSEKTKTNKTKHWAHPPTNQ